jgi:hypothetical protein
MMFMAQVPYKTIVIYNRHMFIVQATGDTVVKPFFSSSLTLKANKPLLSKARSQSKRIAPERCSTRVGSDLTLSLTKIRVG